MIIDNIEPEIVTGLHSYGKTNHIPISASIEITNDCNFCCKMCYVHGCGNKTDGNSDTGKWLDILNQLKEIGTLFLLITGGEPLLRDDFELIYKSACEMGFLVSVNSNLSLLNDNHLSLFREYPPQRINVSLYGASDETYYKLCGVKAYNSVVYNIKKLKDIGINVRINSLVTKENCNDMKFIFDKADELGCEIRFTSYLFPPIRKGFVCGENDSRLISEEAAYYRVQSDKMLLGKELFKNKCSNIVQNKNSAEDSTCNDCSVKCRAGSSTLWIDNKGNVSMCGMISSDNKNNIFSKSLAECWQSVIVNTQNIKLPDECNHCDYVKLCPVCASICKCETGEFDKVPDYICKMTKECYRLYACEYNKMEL